MTLGGGWDLQFSVHMKRCWSMSLEVTDITKILADFVFFISITKKYWRILVFFICVTKTYWLVYVFFIRDKKNINRSTPFVSVPWSQGADLSPPPIGTAKAGRNYWNK
jgi:hypothetical protein